MKGASIYINIPVLCLLVLLSSCKLFQKSGFDKRRYQPGIYHSRHSSANVGNKTSTKTKKKDETSTALSTVNKKNNLKSNKAIEERANPVIFSKAVCSPLLKKSDTDKRSSITDKQKTKTDLTNSFKKFTQKQSLQKRLLKKKKAYGGADPLVEALVTIVFTLLCYLIALILLLLFPTMSQATALALSVVIIIVAIVVLAVVYS